VAEMARSAMTPLLGPEYDDFLFAPLAEDKNGLLLSVLSALARLNLDPWREAAQLAALPKEAATQRLATLIAAQADAPPESLDREKTAARLIALLPISRAKSGRTPNGAAPAGVAPINARAAMYMCVLIVLFAVGSQILVARRQPQAQSGGAHAQTTATTAARGQSPTSQP
jgi:hypothetical protein